MAAWEAIPEQVGQGANNRERARAWNRVRRAQMLLARTQPATPAEAAALLSWLLKEDPPDALIAVALRTVIRGLKAMLAQGRR
jgi:hypothetical protein